MYTQEQCRCAQDGAGKAVAQAEGSPDTIGTQWEGERERRKSTNRAADAQALRRFAESHGVGFFLYGEAFKIDISLWRRVPSAVTFWAGEYEARFVAWQQRIVES